MINFFINQLVLAAFNLINSRIDAYRILSNKSIAHGINFGAYTAFTIILSRIGHYYWAEILIFCLSALFNRQLSFDIPLNLRRGLPWYYQSKADPPKAWWDRVERKLFGVDYDGKKIAAFYAMGLLFTWLIRLYLN